MSSARACAIGVLRAAAYSLGIRGVVPLLDSPARCTAPSSPPPLKIPLSVAFARTLQLHFVQFAMAILAGNLDSSDGPRLSREPRGSSRDFGRPEHHGSD